MSTWQEVFGRGREVARTLKGKGRPTVRYRNTHGDGTPVDGWRLSRLGVSKDETEYYTGTDYKDVHTDSYLILGNDGVLYMFTLLSVENGRREPGGFRVTIDRTPSTLAVYPEMLHPVEYRKFRTDQLMKLLDHLERKGNSNPEPAAPSDEKSETFSKDLVEPKEARTTRPTEGQPTEPTPARTVWPMAEPEEVKSSWKITLLLTLSPFVFLALLALVLFLLGARPN